jgi:starch phosphorylase
MWASLFPGYTEEDVPIGHITNGVHVPTWLAPEMRQVYDRHFGPDWPERAGSAGFWEGIDGVDDGELWETHQTLKVQLIGMARLRAADYAQARGETADHVDDLRQALSLDALTIGFARRFATYKRANLFLQDLELIASLINDPQHRFTCLAGGPIHRSARQGSVTADRQANARSGGSPAEFYS